MKINFWRHVIKGSVRRQLRLAKFSHDLGSKMDVLVKGGIASHVVSDPVIALLSRKTEEGGTRAIRKFTSVSTDKGAARVERAEGHFRVEAELVGGSVGEISERTTECLRGTRADIGRAL